MNIAITALGNLYSDVLLTSVARGDVLYRGASKWNNLAAGAAGSLLMSGGAGADPSWSASLPASIITSGTIGTARLGSGTPDTTTFLRGDSSWQTVTVPTAANPSGLIGMSAVNGVATTFMRSDGRPAIDPAIAPSWTGQHTFGNATTYFGAAAQAATLRQVAPASGAGNNLTISASAAVSGNTNGGNLYLSAGASSGSGTNGRVIIRQLSTNDTNLRLSNSAETVYCDLKIVTDTLQFASSGLINGYVFDTFMRKNNGRWRLGDVWIEAASNAGTRGFAISSGDAIGSPDTGLERSSAGVWKATDASSGNGAFICGQPAVGTVGLTVNQIASATAPLIQAKGISSTSTSREMANIDVAWATSTDASRKARMTFSAWDTAARECIRAEASGSASMLGFHGSSAIAKPTITGSRGGNAALADLLTQLASYGLIADSTTA